MSDPNWPLHKPVIDRDRDAANPPPFVETLSDPAANRLASAVIDNLRVTPSNPHGSPMRFVQYLMKQMGRGDSLEAGDGRELKFSLNAGADSFVTMLRSHIVEFVAKDYARLVRFLDWLPQFLLSEERLAPLPYYERDQPTVGQNMKRMTAATIAAVNAALQHDAVIVRIQPDGEYGYAVRRLPSEAMEKGVIQPALTLVRDNAIREALTHYEKALHAFARGGDENADAIVQASHAVESTMKSILRDKLGNDSCDQLNASKLIAKIEQVGILPPQYQALWNNLNGLLQGAPTIRNKGGGHGAAPGAPDPDAATAELAVNVAGAAIIFLVRQWKA